MSKKSCVKMSKRCQIVKRCGLSRYFCAKIVSPTITKLNPSPKLNLWLTVRAARPSISGGNSSCSWVLVHALGPEGYEELEAVSLIIDKKEFP